MIDTINISGVITLSINDYFKHPCFENRFYKVTHIEVPDTDTGPVVIHGIECNKAGIEFPDKQSTKIIYHNVSWVAIDDNFDPV